MSALGQLSSKHLPRTETRAERISSTKEKKKKKPNIELAYLFAASEREKHYTEK